MDSARIFQNGQSQAVRLPKKYRFSGDSVNIKRIGNAVILLPKNEPWQTLFDSLEHFSSDFMEDRVQPDIQEREEL